MLAGAQLDPCADFLAEFRVGHADDLHVLDLRVAEEIFLDLAREDVLTTADDHVLDAADDVAIALVIDGREIAGVHPAFFVNGFGGLRWIIPVTDHDGVAAGAKLARLAAWNSGAAFIDDFHFEVRLHAAHG